MKMRLLNVKCQERCKHTIYELARKFETHLYLSLLCNRLLITCREKELKTSSYALE